VDEVAERLKDRTKRFAIAVIEFVESLPRSPAGDGVGRQLLRSGLGVVGNYRSACRGRSHAEFTARLGVVLEEIDEAELWLDMRAIFSRACATARAREKRRL
jgi:four helix bundle protein